MQGQLLGDHGIRCRRPYKGQILQRRHRQNRLHWARDMIHNRRQNWTDVVFSDESRYSLRFADGRVRLYRRQRERYHEGYVVERDRFGGGSVMVWGAINHDFRSELVLLHGNLTAQRYINEVLALVLVPLLQHHGHNCRLTFQQDNARAHTVPTTRNYLTQHGIDILEWFEVFPDINCIEHLWGELGHRQQQARNARELGAAVQEEWQNILMPTIQSLVRSMRRRLRTVIANNGDHIRY